MKLQLHPWHRRLLYATSLTLLLSGLIWKGIQRADEAGRAGEALIRWKQPLIALHGGSAMVFVLLLGTLLTGHVRRSWLANRNRRNGVFILSFMGLLTLSGYALYYLSDENVRRWVSQLHWWLGLGIPGVLVLHIWLGRRAVAAKKKSLSTTSHLREPKMMAQFSRG